MGDARLKVADGRWKIKGGRRKLEDGGWGAKDGGWKMEDGGKGNDAILVGEEARAQIPSKCITGVRSSWSSLDRKSGGSERRAMATTDATHATHATHATATMTDDCLHNRSRRPGKWKRDEAAKARLPLNLEVTKACLPDNLEPALACLRPNLEVAEARSPVILEVAEACFLGP